MPESVNTTEDLGATVICCGVTENVMPSSPSVGRGFFSFFLTPICCR